MADSIASGKAGQANNSCGTEKACNVKSKNSFRTEQTESEVKSWQTQRVKNGLGDQNPFQ